MTEQTEEDFWAEERARDAAARGRQTDPSACGTCRKAVEAGGQVQHDECAQRATLLPAPDAPGYELITGLSEDEVHALPARFHIPAFVEPTRSWVCAVCWGDGWSTQWPCKTAVEQGLRVFTAEDYAETAAKRQAAELAEHRAESTTPLIVSRFDTAMEPAPEEDPVLTIGAIAEGGRPVALFLDEETRTKVAGWLAPPVEELHTRIAELEAELADAKRPSYSKRHIWTVWREDQPVHGHFCTEDDARQGSIECWEEDEPACPDYSWRKDGPRLELLVGGEAGEIYISRDDVFGTLAEPEKELAETRAELAKYVGAEPTIAEEMAYLSHCLHAVAELHLPEKLKVDTIPGAYRNGYIHALADVHAALDAPERKAYPPTLPWAALMDEDDLTEFLHELTSTLVQATLNARISGKPADTAVLAELEKVCATWRPIAEAQHAHNTAPGPDSEDPT